jgi:hypothetical protein
VVIMITLVNVDEMVVRVTVDFLVMIHISTEIKYYFRFILQTRLPLLIDWLHELSRSVSRFGHFLSCLVYLNVSRTNIYGHFARVPQRISHREHIP